MVNAVIFGELLESIANIYTDILSLFQKKPKGKV